MSNIVKYHNHFIEAMYRLNLIEQKLLIGIALKSQKIDKFGEDIEYSIREITEDVGIPMNSFKHLEKAIDSLMLTLITVRDAEKEDKWIKFQLLRDSEYDNGKLKINISPKMRPFLIELKEKFTAYKLINIKHLRSEYSIRLFEFCKQYENIARREVQLEELREILGLIERDKKGNIISEKFKMYGHFKTKVLEVARKELAEKCDIYFTYTEKKRGRQVDRIVFKIHQNDNSSIETANELPGMPPPLAPIHKQFFDWLDEKGVNLEINKPLKKNLYEYNEAEIKLIRSGLEEFRKIQKPFDTEGKFFAGKLKDGEAIRSCIELGWKTARKQEDNKRTADEAKKKEEEEFVLEEKQFSMIRGKLQSLKPTARMKLIMAGLKDKDDIFIDYFQENIQDRAVDDPAGLSDQELKQWMLPLVG